MPPGDGTLWLRRAELHRLHHDWDAALPDYRQAAALAPDRPEIHHGLGVMWLEAERPALAMPALDRALALSPDQPGILIARARAYAALGERAAAEGDYARAIARMTTPLPEVYLETARYLAAAGGASVDAGLRILDEGIARLGPVVTLVLLAVEIESDRGRHGAAPARIDILPDGIRDRAPWLARRGDRAPAARAPHHPRHRGPRDPPQGARELG